MTEQLASQPSPLTPAQARLVPYLGEGLTTGQIADRVGLSELTIKSHLRGIARRLRVHGQPAIIAELYRRGLRDRVPVAGQPVARPAPLVPIGPRTFFLAPRCVVPADAHHRTVVVQPDEAQIAALADTWAAHTAAQDTYRTEATR